MLANRFLLRRKDHAVGVGEAVRQALIRNEGLSPARVEVIHNGIPLDPFKRVVPEVDRLAVRRDLHLDVDDIVVIQVARLDYLKDHATAIRAFDLALRSCPRLRLLLVGDGPERAMIEPLIRRLELGDRVQLLGTRTDIPRLLAASDLALLSSISEGIPLVLIEAMAARLPVVSTEVGGIPEIVDPGRTGLLAPSGDAPALAHHLIRLANDPSDRFEMGEAGQERACRLFSETQMHAKYRALYLGWTGKGRS
jgi:glycosyltransferase involved in cell wall biosynthesis